MCVCVTLLLYYIYILAKENMSDTALSLFSGVIVYVRIHIFLRIAGISERAIPAICYADFI